MEEVEEGMGGYVVMGGDVTWGGKYTRQCTDEVWQNCASETCTVLFKCHPNKFNKREKIRN